MNWKFFVGASMLMGGLLLKVGAPLVPIAAGIAVAGIVTWTMQRRSGTHG